MAKYFLLIDNIDKIDLYIVNIKIYSISFKVYLIYFTYLIRFFNSVEKI